jgi:Sigma-70 region 2
MQGRRTPAILRDRQAGEELAQDVFVKAYQRLDTFAVRRPMKPWLVQIAISGHFAHRAIGVPLPQALQTAFSKR